jgi:hypothetical protein
MKLVVEGLQPSDHRTKSESLRFSQPQGSSFTNLYSGMIVLWNRTCAISLSTCTEKDLPYFG